MSAGIDRSTLESYISRAQEAAAQGNLEATVNALYPIRKEKEFEETCIKIESLFNNRPGIDCSNGVNPGKEFCSQIKATILASERKKLGIPNFSDEHFRTLAINSVKNCHRSGEARFLVEQIQDPSMRQETFVEIVTFIGDMDPNIAYDQMKAFALGTMQ